MIDDGCGFYAKELMKKKKYFMFFVEIKHHLNDNGVTSPGFGI